MVLDVRDFDGVRVVGAMDQVIGANLSWATPSGTNAKSAPACTGDAETEQTAAIRKAVAAMPLNVGPATLIGAALLHHHDTIQFDRCAREWGKAAS